jgi:hypothetical protein
MADDADGEGAGVRGVQARGLAGGEVKEQQPQTVTIYLSSVIVLLMPLG